MTFEPKCPTCKVAAYLKLDRPWGEFKCNIHGKMPPPRIIRTVIRMTKAKSKRGRK